MRYATSDPQSDFIFGLEYFHKKLLFIVICCITVSNFRKILIIIFDSVFTELFELFKHF